MAGRCGVLSRVDRAGGCGPGCQTACLEAMVGTALTSGEMASELYETLSSFLTMQRDD